MHRKQHVAARIDLRNWCGGLACRDGANDVERRMDRAIFVGGPAYETEHLTWRIAFNALAAADDPANHWSAELEPILAFAFAPKQQDMRSDEHTSELQSLMRI